MSKSKKVTGCDVRIENNTLVFELETLKKLGIEPGSNRIAICFKHIGNLPQPYLSLIPYDEDGVRISKKGIAKIDEKLINSLKKIGSCYYMEKNSNNDYLLIPEVSKDILDNMDSSLENIYDYELNMEEEEDYGDEY